MDGFGFSNSFFLFVQIPNVISPVVNEPNAPQCLIQQTGISQEQISVISRFAMASIGSQGTVGGLVVAGFVSLLLKRTLIFFFDNGQ